MLGANPSCLATCRTPRGLVARRSMIASARLTDWFSAVFFFVSSMSYLQLPFLAETVLTEYHSRASARKVYAVFGLFRCSFKVLERPLCVRQDARRSNSAHGALS